MSEIMIFMYAVIGTAVLSGIALGSYLYFSEGPMWFTDETLVDRNR